MKVPRRFPTELVAADNEIEVEDKAKEIHDNYLPLIQEAEAQGHRDDMFALASKAAEEFLAWRCRKAKGKQKQPSAEAKS